MPPDVVVAGGGPGGSVFAARLAQRGVSVLVLEKTKFPRFHLGESLLPQSVPVLRALGVMPEMEARFLRKCGAQFHEAKSERTVRYDFAEAFDKSTTYAFQVPRDEFDELLLRRAQALGAEVREEWSVSRVLFENGRAIGVEARDPAGTAHRIDAKYVIDATGRSALLAHAERSITKVPNLDKTALFSHFRNAWRDRGDREGDIQIILFGTNGWFWSIPFKDGRTSFGGVVSSAWMKTRTPGETIDDLYKRAIRECPVASRLLAGAEQMFPAEAAADFSFRVRELGGPGWLAVGDAGGFIDPLFSTGAHLAMHGSLAGADLVADALAANDSSCDRFLPWKALMRRGAELFVGSVQAFYAGSLTEYIFAEKQHPFLRHAVTSMLAGDVFHEDERWSREIRTRFPADLT
jgi:flavin-dependent dehydrogenase